MLEKHGIACDLMHGFDWEKRTSGKSAERLALISAGQGAVNLLALGPVEALGCGEDAVTARVVGGIPAGKPVALSLRARLFGGKGELGENSVDTFGRAVSLRALSPLGLLLQDG